MLRNEYFRDVLKLTEPLTGSYLGFLQKLSDFNSVCLQCESEPPRGRVSAELSKPVERKGAMCVVLEYSL